ncbi:MAG: hypothetical protein GY789_27085 [Hyphomicrobiales bacterium]|nr:hypothetical protein [Hyphomicrobiales bacterium]
MREEVYKHVQSFGTWANAFYYGAPAVVLLAGMYILDVGTAWWTPVLIVYGIVALGNCIAYGFQSANMQMITISDYWEKKLHDNGLH